MLLITRTFWARKALHIELSSQCELGSHTPVGLPTTIYSVSNESSSFARRCVYTFNHTHKFKKLGFCGWLSQLFFILRLFMTMSLLLVLFFDKSTTFICLDGWKILLRLRYYWKYFDYTKQENVFLTVIIYLTSYLKCTIITFIFFPRRSFKRVQWYLKYFHFFSRTSTEV